MWGSGLGLRAAHRELPDRPRVAQRVTLEDAADQQLALGLPVLLHRAQPRLGGKTSMQWVTIITYCFEDEAASGQAEAAVANRAPVSRRRRRRGALPNANATSVTRPRTGPPVGAMPLTLWS